MSKVHNKKPKSGRSRSPNYHLGNATSTSAARPSGKFHTRRLTDKGEIQDVIRHGNIDFNVTEDLSRKTAAPRYSHNIKSNSQKINTQNPQKRQRVGRRQSKDKSNYMVNLHDIYPKLYLSNYEYANSLRNGEYDIIINMASKKIDKRAVKNKLHYISMKEDKSLTYEEFSRKVDIVCNIICEAEQDGKSVLIHCIAGSNRSVGAVIAYAISHKKMELATAINYFDNKKKNSGFPNWDNLSNLHIYHLLQQYEHQQKMKYVELTEDAQELFN